MSVLSKPEKLQVMAAEIESYLKGKDMWETDVAIIYNGQSVSSNGIKDSDREIKGDMLMWFEGPLNHALNYGDGDPNYIIYGELKAIMGKHGYYPEFGSHCDFNIYPI